MKSLFQSKASNLGRNAAFVLTALLSASSAHAQTAVFPANAMINVTSYGADGSDLEDDTDEINAAIQSNINSDKMIYFPNGTYIVSGPLEWRNPAGGWGSGVGLWGQSRTGTIIQLSENLTAYSTPATPRAVIYTASKPGGQYSAVTGGGFNAFRNFIHNLTVDTGTGNPGAVGIDFMGNNVAAIRDVTIRSGDNQGVAGLFLNRIDTGPCLIKNVSITGFDQGIRAANLSYSVTMENITLSNQKNEGIYNDKSTLSIRNLTTTRTIAGTYGKPAIYNHSSTGLITVVNANLSTGGTGTTYAINNSAGRMFLRGVTTSGYTGAVIKTGVPVAGTSVTEWTSHAVAHLFPATLQSLNLPIQETPSYLDTNTANWVDVTSSPYNAVPNDTNDDTAAIQNALNSGKSTVYLPNGIYRINNTLTIPSTVRHIFGCGSNIHIRGTAFSDATAPKAALSVAASADLVIENISFNRISPPVSHPGLIWIQHTGPNKLTLKDIISQGERTAFYRSAIGAGPLFIENVSTSLWQFAPGTQVWARQFNPEGHATMVVNDAANLWVFGLKTEGAATVIETKNGGKTEVLGGFLYPAEGSVAAPAFINNESNVSLTYGTLDHSTPAKGYSKQVTETNDGTTLTLTQTENRVVFPLYVGYPSPSTGTGLKGQYYNGQSFNLLVNTRIDPTINFAWSTGSPMGSVNVDNFTVRWTGQVRAIEGGTYTFATTTDDGARLWVNGQQLINKWASGSPALRTGTIDLAPGQKYNITMEFLEISGSATAKLEWQRPGQTTRQIIPQLQLYPAP